MSVVPIIPARLEYSAGTLYSSGYGDIYHSADGAIEQARHVFLQGCGLPQAWARRASFVILETGFGAGLNFLATWAAWRDDPARCERLHFISAEKHPFTAADLSSLHATWPEFARQSQELRSHWPMLTPGFHRIELDGGRVHLTLMLGDATDCISQLQAKVEAIYLDGFAPDRNPDIWQPALFQQLARVATRVAVLASYTVAASVREGLTAVGFCCEKREGYGRKRHRLSAQFKHASAHENSATTDAPVRAIPRHVAVIGATRHTGYRPGTGCRACARCLGQPSGGVSAAAFARRQSGQQTHTRRFSLQLAYVGCTWRDARVVTLWRIAMCKRFRARSEARANAS
jgi:tRNA 5-methylaminomethyl-2-thiouridine biosynthesis bifunctional protein